MTGLLAMLHAKPHAMLHDKPHAMLHAEPKLVKRNI